MTSLGLLAEAPAEAAWPSMVAVTMKLSSNPPLISLRVSLLRDLTTALSSWVFVEIPIVRSGSDKD